MSKTHLKKKYQTLGYIVFHKRPDIAEELLGMYTHADNETRTELIPQLYYKFCEQKKLKVNNLQGHLDNYDKTRTRRIFFAVILYIYCREVFNHPPNRPVLLYGIGKKIGDCLFVKRAQASILIRQSLYEYKLYDDFRLEVNQIVDQIKPELNGHA